MQKVGKKDPMLLIQGNLKFQHIWPVREDRNFAWGEKSIGDYPRE